MGAAMIAAVSIGLSIDGSVHFLASYQRHRRRGHPVETASVHAAGNVGAAVLLATLALVIGFSVLATSEFVPTATFGVLVAATMVMGTMINLTLLPACVSAVDRR
jgi:predicted RND superfamily exporter protein